MKRILYNFFVFFSGLLCAVLILEIFLRIYNPIPFRVKGNRIILPANQKYIIKNTSIDNLEKKIIHTKNSLGFRGEEIPGNFENYLSIIAVGGSTVECYYLSDNKDWPNLFSNKLRSKFENVWLNNAGLDGHSTFGHTILLKDYLIKIKPKVILFMIGANDVGITGLGTFDKDKMKGYYGSWKNFLTKNSEIIFLIVNLARGGKTRQKGFGHGNIKISEMDTLTLSEDFISKKLLMHSDTYLQSYKKRILKLIELCKENDIEPILLTQPTVVGEEINRLSGIDLSTIKIYDKMNGKLYWKILELYNRATKDAGRETGTRVVDLANLLPKSPVFYYDIHHYTNEGSEKIADILFTELAEYLTIL